MIILLLVKQGYTYNTEIDQSFTFSLIGKLQLWEASCSISRWSKVSFPGKFSLTEVDIQRKRFHKHFCSLYENLFVFAFRHLPYAALPIIFIQVAISCYQKVSLSPEYR